MHLARPRPRRAIAALALGLAVALTAAGCSSSSAKPGGQTTTTTTAARPSSPAKLTIRSPSNGQVVHASSLELRLQLVGAKIVPATTAHIRPDQGHVHVLLDGQLVSMTYGLDQRLTALKPGVHVVRVEFVASDHLPFDPRVLAEAAFQVQP
jgi:hypothetical protein